MSRLSELPSHAVLVAVAVVGLLVFGEAHADDAVLLASTVPGYVPGMVVASTDQLNVPDGATATLLFETGGIVRLRGPFEGTLGQQQEKGGESNVGKVADMFRLHGVDATVIGGTRSTGQTRHAAALEDVQVDPQRSGTYCVEAATSVWITRPATEPTFYTVRRMGKNRTLGWPKGAQRIEWPADVPIEDGSQFEIAADGAAQATVTFHVMPGAAGPGQIVKGLFFGCHEQFDGELRRIRRSVASADLWMTTEHGRRPTFREGEPITLTVMTDIDGFLYCVASKGDGAAKAIFPAGAVDGAQLRASAPLLIPGSRQAVGLTAFPGLAQIRCWLADRDISQELPHALLGAATGWLPDQLTVDLDALFKRLGGTRIVADVLPVRIE